MLIDKEFESAELIKEAGISRSTFYKIKYWETVTTDVLLRICDVLGCDIWGIVERVVFDDVMNH